MFLRYTNLDGLPIFRKSRNCSISHDLASLTICGDGVFPHTPLTFSHLVGKLDDYGSTEYNWNICGDDPDIARQMWPNGAIDRLRDIAQCGKFDRLWLGHFPSCTLDFWLVSSLTRQLWIFEK